MHVIYHNWSAMKQRPHPQNVVVVNIPSTNVLHMSAIGNFEEFSTFYYLGHLMA